MGQTTSSAAGRCSALNDQHGSVHRRLEMKLQQPLAFLFIVGVSRFRVDLNQGGRFGSRGLAVFGQIVVAGTIASIGHMRAPAGTSIVDVADPAHPRLLARLEMPPGTHSHKVRVDNGSMLINRQRNHADKNAPPENFRGGLGVYDVTKPASPRENTLGDRRHGRPSLRPLRRRGEINTACAVRAPIARRPPSSKRARSGYWLGFVVPFLICSVT